MRNLWRGLALSAALVFVAVAVLITLGQPPAESSSVAIGKVTGVYDGDTFAVDWLSGAGDVPGGRDRVRLYLIDAPELGQCFWGHAQHYADRLIFGQIIWVYHWGETSGNRLLGFAYLDSQRQSWFGAIMVAQGYAQLHEDAPYFARTQIPSGQGQRYLELLQVIQSEARDAGRGLWAACY